MNWLEQVRELYQNDDTITIGAYQRLLAEAECRDDCTCGGNGVCIACVLYGIEIDDAWRRA